MKNIVILGAGTAGTMMANRLRTRLPQRDWAITVVDRDDAHLYQPGLLFVPFGAARAEDLVRSRRALFEPGVEVCLEGLERVEPETKSVRLGSGRRLEYDVLIVATGTRLAPEETPGLTGPGWHQNVFDFYTLAGATALAERMERFDGGRVLVHFADLPIKCPVAPLEFALLADAYFTQRGIRERIELVYVTPLDAAFTKPRASAMLGDLFARRNIRLETDFAVSRVDGEHGLMEAYGGAVTNFDLLVTVPTHRGAAAIEASGLGNEAGFVPTEKHSLRARHHPDIFVLGDATDVPTSKAGSVAHFQAEVLTENVLRHVRGLELLEAFDGHANCFVESGHGKAVLIDFNYDTEPLPGRFPLPGLGPFTLLEESAVNHWGKLGFKWVYWNLLVRGKDLPLDHRMLLAGKREAA